MSNFLNNLAARSLNLAPVAQPRTASRFETRPLSNAFDSTLPFGEKLVETERVNDEQAVLDERMLTNKPTLSDIQMLTVDRTVRKPTVRVNDSEQSAAAPTHAPLIRREQQNNSVRQADNQQPHNSTSSQSVARLPVMPIKIESQSSQATSPEAAHTLIEKLLTSATDNPTRDDGAMPDSFMKEDDSVLERQLRRLIAEHLNAGAGRQHDAVSNSTLSDSHGVSQHSSQSASTHAPTIRVTIGRIDVRAITSPPPQQPRPAPVRPAPQLSLADYLKQRSGGRR
jgi:hypothetical protein